MYFWIKTLDRKEQTLFAIVAIILVLPKYLKISVGSNTDIIPCVQLRTTSNAMNAGDPFSGNTTAYVPYTLFSTSKRGEAFAF